MVTLAKSGGEIGKERKVVSPAGKLDKLESSPPFVG
jgi:hypothetical protein